MQTFVQISAGVTRMPLRLYLPAVAVGSVVWALIYGTVGMAVILAWPVLVLLIAAIVLLIVVMRRRR